MQVYHDQIRQLPFRKNISIRKAHRMRTVYSRHPQYLMGIHRSRVLLQKLRKTGHKKHLTEHIQTVIAGRTVRTDSHVDTLFHKPSYRCDTAGQLHIGARIRHDMQSLFCKQLHILFRKIAGMISSAPKIKHAERIKKRRRRHPVTRQAFLRFQLRL